MIGRAELVPATIVVLVVLSTCAMHKEIPVPLPDADTRVTAPAPDATTRAAVEQATDAAPQRVADTEATNAAYYPAGRLLESSPGETLARQRQRPARPSIFWRRLDGCRLEADAPEGAISLRDRSLTRPVYWCDAPASWIGKLRIERYCGQGPTEIEIEFNDGRIETITVPTVPCGGY